MGLDVVAVVGVVLGAAVGTEAVAELGQLGLERAQVAQSLVDLTEALLDHGGNVAARLLAAFAEGEDLLDFAKGEAEALGGLDEAQAVRVGLAVQAVAGAGASGLGNQPDALVVADGARVEFQPRCELTDRPRTVIGCR